MIPGTPFLSICVPLNLENQLPVPKCRQDIPFQTKRNEKRSHVCQDLYRSHAHSIRCQILGTVWQHYSRLLMSSQSPLPFFMKGSTCLQLSSFLSLFLTCGIVGSLPIFGFIPPPSFSVQGSSVWHNILQNFVDLVCLLGGFSSLDWRPLHKAFLGSPISIFGFF